MSKMIATWDELRALALALALALDLDAVTDAVSWGNPVLKAHGKLWVWWSPHIDAAIFKGARDEREALIAADPRTFLFHPHYRNRDLILVAAGRIDPDWARARLRATWQALAPKSRRGATTGGAG